MRLWVIEGVDVHDADGHHWERPAPRPPTDVEVIEAARNIEGARREWYCLGEGNQCGPHSFLWRDETHDRCGWRLVVPLERTGEPE